MVARARKVDPFRNVQGDAADGSDAVDLASPAPIVIVPVLLAFSVRFPVPLTAPDTVVAAGPDSAQATSCAGTRASWPRTSRNRKRGEGAIC